MNERVANTVILVLLIMLVIALFVFVSWLVMVAWNAVFPALFGWGRLDLWQAMALNVLLSVIIPSAIVMTRRDRRG